MPYVRFFKYIVPLQITTGLLSLVIIFMLFIALKIDGPHTSPPGLNGNNNGTITPPPPNNTNQTTTIPEETSATSSEGNFLTYEQLSISILVVLGCVVSLLAPYRLKPNYRFSMVWVMSIAGLVAGISQFIMIGLRGGCTAAYYQEQRSRCSIQLVVSTMDIVWVIMLLVEGALNYQRSVDKDFQTRLREQEEAGSERWRWSVTSVVYNPDLELAQRQQQTEEDQEGHAAAAEAREEELGDGEGSDIDEDLEEGDFGRATGESSTGRRRRAPRRLVIQTPVEVEPLPKYKPKPARGQPRIHDLGNMPPPPPPPPPPSTPPPPVSPLEPSSSSLSLFPEGVLPSTTTTITISTGGTDSGTTAGTGTRTGQGSGIGIGSGVAEDTIPSSLPPSYSA